MRIGTCSEALGAHQADIMRTTKARTTKTGALKPLYLSPTACTHGYIHMRNPNLHSTCKTQLTHRPTPHLQVHLMGRSKAKQSKAEAKQSKSKHRKAKQNKSKSNKAKHGAWPEQLFGKPAPCERRRRAPLNHCMWAALHPRIHTYTCDIQSRISPT